MTRYFTDQAELFLVAAVCTAGGFFLLYLALGLYGLCINKIIRWLCVWGAIFDYINERRNRKRWWNRLPTWLERITGRDK